MTCRHYVNFGKICKFPRIILSECGTIFAERTRANNINGQKYLKEISKKKIFKIF